MWSCKRGEEGGGEVGGEREREKQRWTENSHYPHSQLKQTQLQEICRSRTS